MSIIKKGIKAIGKLVKKVVNFVKDHWKEILVVALAVYGIGLATVGWEAFTASIAEFGGGFMGTMQAVGSTMWAGVTAIGGSLGLGAGAQGTVAGIAGVEGMGVGAALGWGGSGLGLGVTPAEYAANAASLGVGTGQAAIGAAKGAAAKGMTAVEASQVGQGVGEAVGVMSSHAPGAALEAVGGGAAGGSSIASTALQNSAALIQGGKAGMDPLVKASLIMTGGNVATNVGAALMAQEDEDPMRAYWGVDLTIPDNQQPIMQPGAQPAGQPAGPQGMPPRQPLPQVQAPVQYTQIPSPIAQPQAAPQISAPQQPRQPGLMDMWAPPGGIFA